MTEDLGLAPEGTEEGRVRGRHSAVDGLMVGRTEVWVMVARPGDSAADLLWADENDSDRRVPRICKAVLEGGVLLLGDADPDDDPLLSDLMRGEDLGTA